MTANGAYLGTNRKTPFHSQKFDLSQFFIYYNGLPIVGTPNSTASNQRLCFNTLQALDFLEKGGPDISTTNYPNHFIMNFELTSTQEASQDFIHPELTV